MVFRPPLTKTSYITPHYYPKYKVQAIEFVLWDDPFFPFCLTIFHFREFTNLKHHINQQHSQVRSLLWNIAVSQTKTTFDIFALLHCPTTQSTMLQLKKYKCGDCGYSCYLKTDLERHITNVHEKVCKTWSRPFNGSNCFQNWSIHFFQCRTPCPICGKKYSDLRQHIRLVHEGHKVNTKPSLFLSHFNFFALVGVPWMWKKVHKPQSTSQQDASQGIIGKECILN